ncbi:radical SAM protein [Patescibacteria group bacterium]|nr:radical SAM protein [Patescibacteria group bacterium]
MKYPSYLNLTEKELNSRIEKANQMLESCRVCPRKCGANRTKNEKGYCYLGNKAVVFSFNPGYSEEKFLIGKYGTGAINFNFCNLSCAYCQSYNISQLERGRIVPGKEVSDKALAKIMLKLQKLGCHNINLINPTSQVPQILASLPHAIKGGLKIPLVYNTNSYDSVETLKLLSGIVDIYLPDFKYSDEKMAVKYSQAPGYFEIAKKSIKEMHRQVGNLEIGTDDLIKKGLFVRHLILPSNLAGSERVLKFLAKRISPNTFVNIMNRYSPCWRTKEFPEINRIITTEEYKNVVELAKNYNLKWFTE